MSGKQDVLDHLAEVGQGVFSSANGHNATTYYLNGIECTDQIEALLRAEIIGRNPSACGAVFLLASPRKS